MVTPRRIRQWCGQGPGGFLAHGLGFFVFAILAGLPLVAAEPSYTVIDLGKNSEATAINDSGEVVGYVRTPDGDFHGFLYSQGHVHDLGTLGGPKSFAEGINSAGVVVGLSDTAGVVHQGRPISRAFIYSSGTMRAIGMENNGLADLDSTSACDINSSGQIAVQTPILRAAIWSRGIAQYLGTLVPKGVGYPLGKETKPDGTVKELRTEREGYTVPYRINDSGEGVGDAVTPDGNEHAFLYSDGRMRDLNLAGWKNSHARDINARGDVVGFLGLDEGKQRAFLFSDGETKDLGVPAAFGSSCANGINARGQIVGYAYSVTGGGFLWVGVKGRAFLYESGQWIDLSSRVDLVGTGLTELYDAQRINARGQIIGKAMGPDGYHAYLLTPK
jgi:probable HAF family extracellular repeat protein